MTTDRDTLGARLRAYEGRWEVAQWVVAGVALAVLALAVALSSAGTISGTAAQVFLAVAGVLVALVACWLARRRLTVVVVHEHGFAVRGFGRTRYAVRWEEIADVETRRFVLRMRQGFLTSTVSDELTTTVLTTRGRKRRFTHERFHDGASLAGLITGGWRRFGPDDPDVLLLARIRASRMTPSKWLLWLIAMAAGILLVRWGLHGIHRPPCGTGHPCEYDPNGAAHDERRDAWVALGFGCLVILSSVLWPVGVWGENRERRKKLSHPR